MVINLVVGVMDIKLVIVLEMVLSIVGFLFVNYLIKF